MTQSALLQGVAYAVMVPFGCISSMLRCRQKAKSQSRGRAVGKGKWQTTQAEADSQGKPTGRPDGKPKGRLEGRSHAQAACIGQSTAVAVASGTQMHQVVSYAWQSKLCSLITGINTFQQRDL